MNAVKKEPPLHLIYIIWSSSLYNHILKYLCFLHSFTFSVTSKFKRPLNIIVYFASSSSEYHVLEGNITINFTYYLMHIYYKNIFLTLMHALTVNAYFKLNLVKFFIIVELGNTIIYHTVQTIRISLSRKKNHSDPTEWGSVCSRITVSYWKHICCINLCSSWSLHGECVLCVSFKSLKKVPSIFCDSFEHTWPQFSFVLSACKLVSSVTFKLQGKETERVWALADLE